MDTRLLAITDCRVMQAKMRQLQATCGIHVKTAADITTGLKELFFGQPPLVLLQKDLGGIPTAVVAAQVRRLLDKTPPRIVLLARGNEAPQYTNEFNDSLGMDSPIEHMARVIISHLRHSSSFLIRK